MKVHIINLEAEDDHASVRDKISLAKAAKIVLVWPRRGKPLASRLDLEIVHRHSLRGGRQLGLISYDPEVAANAARIHLPVFDSLEELPEGDWNGTVRSPLRKKGPTLSELREVRDAAGLHSPAPLANHTRGTIFGTAVAALAALVVVIVPRAQIVIDPSTSPFQGEVKFWIDPQSGGSSSRIPGQTGTVQVSGQKRLATTGRVRLPFTAAQGEIAFTNLTNEFLTIPAGTGVRAGEVRFQTAEDVELDPSNSSVINVEVQAAEPGRTGNVAAGAIDAVEGPLGFLVSVRNPQATSGGQDRVSDTVSLSDLQELRSQLQAELIRAAQLELEARLDRDHELVPGSARVVGVVEEQFDAQPGEATSSLGLSLTIEAEALSFSSETALAAVEQAIRMELPTDRVLIPDSVSIEPTHAVPDFPAVEVTFAAQGTFAQSIDGDRLRGEILGSAKRNAGQRLAELFELPKAPTIETWPSWFPWVPWLGIQVDLRWSWETA